jgi:hypothetical protein
MVVDLPFARGRYRIGDTLPPFMATVNDGKQA